MQNRPLHYRKLWLVIGFALVALAIWFSLVQLPPQWAFHLGKGPLHAASYALITLWFGLIYHGAGRQLGIACAFIVMGVVIEYLQVEMTTLRRFDAADMVANGVGAITGWLLLRTPVRGVLHRLDAYLAGRS